ncbi:YraN family protein [Tranquillimonas rosea]|uniref:YraN family protein n=1 Tax=Tranquillimonas rosea TaxID=641238 RepID=UPI003BAD4BEC
MPGGAVGYHAGLSAEEQVAAHYRRSGHEIAHRRWRGRGGEIDIVARQGDTMVFVEVKAACSHGRAAARIGRRQIERIYAAAGEYVAGNERGLDTDMRFEVALVDGAGRIEIVENAFL